MGPNTVALGFGYGSARTQALPDALIPNVLNHAIALESRGIWDLCVNNGSGALADYRHLETWRSGTAPGALLGAAAGHRAGRAAPYVVRPGDSRSGNSSSRGLDTQSIRQPENAPTRDTPLPRVRVTTHRPVFEMDSCAAFRFGDWDDVVSAVESFISNQS